MANVLIVAYLLIVLALIAVILLQRSEGGGLGMGSSSGGLISVRGSANLLTRTTAILATLFFATAIGLTLLSEIDRGTQGILDSASDAVGEGTGPLNVLDALNTTSGSSDLPVPEGPVATTTTTTTTDPGLALPVPTTPAETASTAPTTTLSDPGLAAPANSTPAAPAN